MAINKVVYGDDTLIDLTQDSVSAENLLEGETAHDRSGNPVTGTAKQGHILKNQAGTVMTQRANMLFKDAGLSDNSAGAATEVEIIHQLTKTQLDALGENTDGIYETTDEEDIPIGDVEEDYVEVEQVVGGTKTWGELIGDLNSLVDYNKINGRSFIVLDDMYFFSITIKGNNYCYFNTNYIDSSTGQCSNIIMRPSGGYTERTFAGVFTSHSNEVPSEGEKITLYYGNKAAVVELNTDAQHCIMSDGETSVEEAIENIFKYKTLLTSSDDLNTLFTVGNYRTIAASGLPTNYPSTAGNYNANIKVEYTESNGMTIQTFEQFISGVPYTYKRRYFNGTWGNWQKIALTSDISDYFKTTTMTPNISVPAGGYNFCSYDKPTGYRLISVDMGSNSLALFCQISKFGGVNRLSFFNAYTQDMTISHSITLTFIKE